MKTNIAIHADGDAEEVTAHIRKGRMSGRHALHIEIGDASEVVIYFNNIEQLQGFDEQCHGAIEDALFRHAHGVSEQVAELAQSTADDSQDGTP